MLSAEVSVHEDADGIILILKESESLDLDSRQEDWRRDDWSSPPPVHPRPGAAAATSRLARVTLIAAAAGCDPTFGRRLPDRRKAEL